MLCHRALMMMKRGGRRRPTLCAGVLPDGVGLVATGKTVGRDGDPARCEVARCGVCGRRGARAG